jgi:hypothetical protein
MKRPLRDDATRCKEEQAKEQVREHEREKSKHEFKTEQ